MHSNLNLSTHQLEAVHAGKGSLRGRRLSKVDETKALASPNSVGSRTRIETQGEGRETQTDRYRDRGGERERKRERQTDREREREREPEDFRRENTAQPSEQQQHQS
jgi:hypothetical protein